MSGLPNVYKELLCLRRDYHVTTPLHQGALEPEVEATLLLLADLVATFTPTSQDGFSGVFTVREDKSTICVSDRSFITFHHFRRLLDRNQVEQKQQFKITDCQVPRTKGLGLNLQILLISLPRLQMKKLKPAGSVSEN